MNGKQDSVAVSQHAIFAYGDEKHVGCSGDFEGNPGSGSSTWSHAPRITGKTGGKLGMTCTNVSCGLGISPETTLGRSTPH